MLAVGLGAESLMQTLDDEAALDEFGRRVSVAAINSPSAVTIAGDGDVLDDIARQLDEAEIFNRYLTGKVPYHTHYMDAVKDDLCSAFEGLSSNAGDASRCTPRSPANSWTDTLPAPPTGGRTPAPPCSSNRRSAGCWTMGTPTSWSWDRIPCWRRRFSRSPERRRGFGPGDASGAIDDDSRTLLNCVGALHSHGHDVAWHALNPRGGARLLKLPSYPWQTKRFWNETQEAAEDLHYNPVHPLLGQPVSAVHPTWEAELSTAVNPFLADHRVQGSVVVPGAVYVEMALAAARQTYGSDHSVDDLVLHRALILDDTCDPIVRTTLNQDSGTIEFAAFTATADGDFKWTITATAELNTLSAATRGAATRRRDARSPSPRSAATTSTPAPRPSGSTTATRSGPSSSVTAGEGWAVAEIAVPAQIADELDDYRFHPALIDGAFQTLFGAPFLGQDARATSPYLPTRIRHCAVYGRARRAHDASTCGSSRPPQRRSNATSRSPTRSASRSPSSTASSVQSLSASSAHVARTHRQGTLRDPVGRETPRASPTDRATATRRLPSRPGSSSSTPPVSGQPSRTNCAAAATASGRSNTEPSTRSPKSTAGMRSTPDARAVARLLD